MKIKVVKLDWVLMGDIIKIRCIGWKRFYGLFVLYYRRGN